MTRSKTWKKWGKSTRTLKWTQLGRFKTVEPPSQHTLLIQLSTWIMKMRRALISKSGTTTTSRAPICSVLTILSLVSETHLISANKRKHRVMIIVAQRWMRGRKDFQLQWMEYAPCRSYIWNQQALNRNNWTSSPTTSTLRRKKSTICHALVLQSRSVIQLANLWTRSSALRRINSLYQILASRLKRDLVRIDELA